jgi:hypothetical protein
MNIAKNIRLEEVTFNQSLYLDDFTTITYDICNLTRVGIILINQWLTQR